MPREIDHAQLPSDWACALNAWDPEHSSCAAPEESEEQEPALAMALFVPQSVHSTQSTKRAREEPLSAPMETESLASSSSAAKRLRSELEPAQEQQQEECEEEQQQQQQQLHLRQQRPLSLSSPPPPPPQLPAPPPLHQYYQPPLRGSESSAAKPVPPPQLGTLPPPPPRHTLPRPGFGGPDNTHAHAHVHAHAHAHSHALAGLEARASLLERTVLSLADENAQLRAEVGVLREQAEAAKGEAASCRDRVLMLAEAVNALFAARGAAARAGLGGASPL